MIAYLTRRVTFSAAHRLHSCALSTEENSTLYGKCNNAWGHGHEYALEITVRGPIDPRTGMIINLRDLKAAMQEQIVEVLDHRHLNHDIPWLAGINPTVENLAVVCWQRLQPALGDLLYRVQLYETLNNWAVYSGE